MMMYYMFSAPVFVSKFFSFNFRLKNVTEFDCYVKAFVYLINKTPINELLEPCIEEAAEKPMADVLVQIKAFTDSASDGLTKLKMESSMSSMTLDLALGRCTDLMAVEDDIFPCLLAICGSGLCYIQVCCMLAFYTI